MHIKRVAFVLGMYVCLTICSVAAPAASLADPAIFRTRIEEVCKRVTFTGVYNESDDCGTLMPGVLDSIDALKESLRYHDGDPCHSRDSLYATWRGIVLRRQNEPAMTPYNSLADFPGHTETIFTSVYQLPACVDAAFANEMTATLLARPDAAARKALFATWIRTAGEVGPVAACVVAAQCVVYLLTHDDTPEGAAVMDACGLRGGALHETVRVVMENMLRELAFMADAAVHARLREYMTVFCSRNEYHAFFPKGLVCIPSCKWSNGGCVEERKLSRFKDKWQVLLKREPFSFLLPGVRCALAERRGTWRYSLEALQLVALATMLPKLHARLMVLSVGCGLREEPVSEGGAEEAEATVAAGEGGEVGEAMPPLVPARVKVSLFGQAEEALGIPVCKVARVHPQPPAFASSGPVGSGGGVRTSPFLPAAADSTSAIAPLEAVPYATYYTGQDMKTFLVGRNYANDARDGVDQKKLCACLVAPEIVDFCSMLPSLGDVVGVELLDSRPKKFGLSDFCTQLQVYGAFCDDLAMRSLLHKIIPGVDFERIRAMLTMAARDAL